MVSREWQVKNFSLLINEYKSNNNNIDVLFLCSDLISKGNSHIYLKKITIYNYILLPNYNNNHILFSIKSTRFIVDFIKNNYTQDLRNVLFISDNYSNIFASSIRNIKFIFKSQLINVQHGENYFNNQEFDYDRGWHQVKSNQYFISKKKVIDVLLLIIASLYYFKVFNIFQIFKNSIHTKYNYLSFADKIIVSSFLNKKFLIKNGINKKLITIVGSILTDKKVNSKIKTSHNSLNYDSAIIYSSGTYRKALNSITRNNQKLFFCKISEILNKLNLTHSFKLKPDEEFYFKKDFPNSCFFNDNVIFNNHVKDFKKVLHIVPVDSTMCLEFSLQNISYLTFSSWNSLSAIGLLNVNSGVDVLKYDSDLEELLNKIKMILNFQTKLKVIGLPELESMLGSLNESYNEKLYKLIK